VVEWRRHAWLIGALSAGGAVYLSLYIPRAMGLPASSSIPWLSLGLGLGVGSFIYALLSAREMMGEGHGFLLALLASLLFITLALKLHRQTPAVWALEYTLLIGSAWIFTTWLARLALDAKSLDLKSRIALKEKWRMKKSL